MKLEGLPVVRASEMKKAEIAAFESGESELAYMENAGSGIALLIEEFLVTPRTHEHIYLLVGKGNNGGDALKAGEILLNAGFSVKAFLLFDIAQCSELSQKMAQHFKSAGGKMVHLSEVPDFEEDGVILDGLFGTGFQGEVDGLFEEVIDAANDSGLPIFAIDIPSGLNGSTGAVEGSAIQADFTIYLGLPKIGFFIGSGWDHVGKLLHVDFGMPEKFLKEIKVEGYLVSEDEVACLLPQIDRSRHKYEAGYVLAVAGSLGMPGAALMSCLSALKIGAGIVRLFYPNEMKEELNNAPYEVIKEGWDLKNDSRIFEEEQRAKAMLVGPGCGREARVQMAIENVLSKTELPCVIDADALYFLAKNRNSRLPRSSILTPHHQEMKRILDKDPDFTACQEYVDDRGVTLVLKGAPTVIFHPKEKPLIVGRGDPGMATAGTGDVLTGVIAAFLAQGLNPRAAATVGVFVHALSGEIAAREETSYGVIASDLIHALPDALRNLLS